MVATHRALPWHWGPVTHFLAAICAPALLVTLHEVVQLLVLGLDAYRVPRDATTPILAANAVGLVLNVTFVWRMFRGHRSVESAVLALLCLAGLVAVQLVGSFSGLFLYVELGGQL